MRSLATRATTTRATTISLSPPTTPRLRLPPPRPPHSDGTLLDGGWWPRSTEPAAELPGLILALQAHTPTDDHGPITHVMLRRADWNSHPRRLRVQGPAQTRVVRLSWFDSLPAGLLTAIYADGHRLDLLTIPPQTGQAEAQAAMELAAHADNHIHTPDLLAALTKPATPTTPATPATPAWPAMAPTSTSENNWESEGGRLHEHPKAGQIRQAVR